MRLNFIQDFRNRIVHRGEAGDHALLCAHYGSIYLSELIQFFLWNRYKLRSREAILDITVTVHSMLRPPSLIRGLMNQVH